MQNCKHQTPTTTTIATTTTTGHCEHSRDQQTDRAARLKLDPRLTCLRCERASAKQPIGCAFVRRCVFACMREQSEQQRPEAFTCGSLSLSLRAKQPLKLATSLVKSIRLERAQQVRARVFVRALSRPVCSPARSLADATGGCRRLNEPADSDRSQRCLLELQPLQASRSSGLRLVRVSSSTDGSLFLSNEDGSDKRVRWHLVQDNRASRRAKCIVKLSGSRNCMRFNEIGLERDPMKSVQVHV